MFFPYVCIVFKRFFTVITVIFFAHFLRRKRVFSLLATDEHFFCFEVDRKTHSKQSDWLTAPVVPVCTHAHAYTVCIQQLDLTFHLSSVSVFYQQRAHAIPFGISVNFKVNKWWTNIFYKKILFSNLTLSFLHRKTKNGCRLRLLLRQYCRRWFFRVWRMWAVCSHSLFTSTRNAGWLCRVSEPILIMSIQFLKLCIWIVCVTQNCISIPMYLCLPFPKFLIAMFIFRLLFVFFSDIFFKFTCISCTDDGKETFEREKLPW